MRTGGFARILRVMHRLEGADLHALYQLVRVKLSLLFNEGRQWLSGNVGYRIIEANIRDLIEGAPGQLSWC